MRDRWKSAVLTGLLAVLVFAPSALALSPYDILVVNDGHMLEGQSLDVGGPTDRMMAERYVAPIRDAFDEVNITYVNTTADGFGPDLEMMKNYDMVLWYTLGDTRNTNNCPGDYCQTLFGSDKTSGANAEGDPFEIGGDIENITRYVRNHHGRIMLAGARLNTDVVSGTEFMEGVFSTQIPSFNSPNRQVYICDIEGFCENGDFLQSSGEIFPAVYTETVGPIQDAANYTRLNRTFLGSNWRNVIYEREGDEDGDTGDEVRENHYWLFSDIGDGYEAYTSLDLDGDGQRDEFAHSMIRNSNETFKFLNFAFDISMISDEYSPGRRTDILERSVEYLLGPRADTSDISEKPVQATIGEAGHIRGTGGAWQNISFQNRYQTPVVVGAANGETESRSVVIEARNVSATWAEVRACDSSGGGGSGCGSVEESIGYMVIDAQKTDRVRGIEAGRFEAGDRFSDEKVDVTYEEEMEGLTNVFGTVQTSEGESPVHTIFVGQENGFEGGICYQDGTDTCAPSHAEETVGWVAIDETFDDHLIENRRDTLEANQWSRFDLGQQYSDMILDDNFNGGIADPRWSISGDYEINNDCFTSEGTAALELEGGGDAQAFVDLSGRDSVTVSYDVYHGNDDGCENPDGDESEDLYVQYRLAGGGWQTLQIHEADGSDPAPGSSVEYTLNLPAAALHSGAAIRFDNKYGTGGFDEWVIDDVEIGDSAVGLTEIQSDAGGQRAITPAITAGPEEGMTRYCEIEDGTCDQNHVGEDLAWAVLQDGSITAPMYDHPSYTDGPTNLTSTCINRQQVIGTNVRDARFYVNTSASGVPANHRQRNIAGKVLEPVPGQAFGQREVDVKNTTYDPTQYADGGRGTNITVAFQCQDNEAPHNYWGPYEKDWIQADTEPPISLDNPLSSFTTWENYTNQEVHNVSLSFPSDPTLTPDLARFSCQSDGPWTDWREYDYTRSSQNFSFDLTDRLNGCTSQDRNVTVHAEIRDFANNTEGQQISDWIVLDRDDPTIESLEPQNRYINMSDMLRLNASDDEVLSTGIEAPGSVFFNGSRNQTLPIDTFFDPGYRYPAGAQGLTYTWYDTSGYSNSYADGPQEMNGFFNDGNDGVVFGGSGRHEEHIYWFDSDFVNAEDKPGYLPGEQFSWKVEGTIYAPTDGTYTFGLDSDDASDVFIDGERVVDFYGSHPPNGDWSVSGQEQLQRGWHDLTVRMQDGGGGNGVGLAWQRPGQDSFQVIPYRFISPSRNTLSAWVFDRASNLAAERYNLTLDVTAPTFDDVTPANDTFIAPDDTITINASDDLRFGFLRLTDDDDPGNPVLTTDEDYIYTTPWTAEERKNITVRLNDSAGNINTQLFSYRIDDSVPVLEDISEQNNTYINTQEFVINVSDDRSGLGTMQASNGTQNTTSFQDGQAFDVGWSSEGIQELRLYIPDRVGNVLTKYYNYTLDLTKPTVSTNISWSSRQNKISGYWPSNVAFSIEATDNFGHEYIEYCIVEGGQSCQPDLLSGKGQNVSDVATCPDGETCELYVNYRANDTAGNLRARQISDNILIDKGITTLEFDNPADGATVSGVITIRTTIGDGDGTGITDVQFDINEVGTGTTLLSGNLNASNNWDVTWNTSQDLSGQLQDVWFNVTAIDRVPNTREESIGFTVDNTNIIARIVAPGDGDFVSTPFALNATAESPGAPDLVNHSFTITDPDGTVVAEDSVTGIGDDSHEFNRFIDASAWTQDGTYTLTTVTWDSASATTTDTTSFTLDRQAPTATINSPGNDSWQREFIDVDVTAQDAVQDDRCFWRYRTSGGTWQGNNSISCGSSQTFSFNTDQCGDTYAPECLIEIYAIDAAGNLASDRINLRVDNKAPSTNVTGPPAGSWQNEDFVVGREDADNVVPTDQLTCQWRNGSGQWLDMSGSCDGSLTVDIGQYCKEEGEDACSIGFRSEDIVGWRDTASRSFSIDTRKPRITSVSPSTSGGTVINGSQDITVRYTDPKPGSGVQFARYDSGIQQGDLTSGQSFDPGWQTDGPKDLTVKLNDSADNLRNVTYEYILDVTPPNVTGAGFNVSLDPAFGEYRIYPGQPIRFEAGLQDNRQVAEATATFNTSSNPVEGENISLERINGSQQAGTWVFEYDQTDQTGLYNVTHIYMEDGVVNRNATTDLPSFRVVEYDLDVDLDGGSIINAGQERNLTVTGDLNRTIDDTARVYVPLSRPSANRTPYYTNTSPYTCSFGSSCEVERVFHEDGIAYVTVNGTGSTSFNLEADVRAYAPPSNTDTRWRSVVQGTVQTNDTEVLAPDMFIGSITCNGSQTCRTNQSEPLNLSVNLQNRNTSASDGFLNDTFVNITNASIGESIEQSFGDIPSGNSSQRNMTLNVSQAGNITFRLDAFETFTDTYTDTATQEVHVRDTTDPEFFNVTLDPEAGYVNDTINVTVNATDNLALETVNATLDRPDGTAVNVSLEESSGTEWVASYNNTTTGGTYDIEEVLLIDTYGNQDTTSVTESFEVGEIDIRTAASTTGTVDDLVNVSVNVTGNITDVSAVEAIISKPRNYTETPGFEVADGASDYLLSYANATRSGNYTVNVTVEADDPTGTGVVRRWNVSADLFEIDYGMPGILMLDEGGGTIEIPENTALDMTWSIVPGMGDLIGANTTLEFNDTSVIDITTGENALHELGNVTYEEGEIFEQYEVETATTGAAELNLSVETENGGFETHQTDIRVLPEDTEDPNITMYGETPDVVNKGQPIVIEATAEDNSVLKNLTTVIYHPENGTNYTEDPEAMNRVGADTFRHTFTNTTEAGHYTYMIRAWDVAGNNDTIVSNSFDVREQYSVNVTSDRPIYKKSDTALFTMEVTDVNGDPVEDYDATVILSKNGTNMTMNQNGYIETDTYEFSRSDPPTPSSETVPLQYKLFVNVSGEGNVGSSVERFDVTRLLDIEAVSPQQGDFVPPGEEFDFTVTIEGPNGELVSPQLAYAICELCPSDFATLNGPDDQGQFTATLQAPQDEDSILVQVIANDLRGNSESQDQGPQSLAPAITLDVGNDTSPGPGPGAGGGGGGGGGFGTLFEAERVSPAAASLPSNTSEVNLSVSTSLAAECRYTTRPLNIIRVDAMDVFNTTGGQLHWETVPAEPGTTYSYNVYCEDSAGENTTLEVVFSVASETIASFGLFIPETIPADGTGIQQGTEQATPFSVFNNGTETIAVDVSSEVTDCCEAWVTDGDQRITEFDLEQGAERSLQLHVDVPLNTSLERYTVDLAFESQGRARERAVRFQVIKGNLIERLETLKNRSRQIQQTLQDYRESGIDVSDIEDRHTELIEIIGYADQAVAEDSRTVLETQLGDGESLANEIEGQLRALAFQNYIRETWWQWLLGALLVHTIFFLLTMVAVPYYRLQTDLIAVKNKLESATEARKKAERQYFKRQIDRDTFMDIMTDRQDEILELRGERDEIQDKMDNIFENRLTLENYVKAPIKAIREINRWIEARRTKAETEDDESEER